MPEEMLTRFMQPALATLNEQSLTVEAVIATGNPVERQDARGRFWEMLLPSGLDVAASRDAPLVDAHNIFSVESLYGRVEQYRIEGQNVIALLKFSKSPSARDVFSKVMDSTIRQLSIGYRPLKQESTTLEGQRAIRLTAWQIGEVSLVTIPADPNTGFRQSQQFFNNNGGNPMYQQQNQNQQQQPNQAPQQQPMQTTSQLPTAEDRKLIRSIGRDYEIPTEFVDDLLDRGLSVADSKSAILDYNTKQRKTKSPIIRQGFSNDNPEVFRTRASKALMVKMGSPFDAKDQEAGAVREMLNKSVGEIALEHLQRSGVDAGGATPVSVFEKRAGELTTTDFPRLLTDAGTGILLMAYREAEPPLKMVATRRDLPDFIAQNTIRVGGYGLLEETEESGEITSTSANEASAPIQLKSWTRAVDFSRKALANDRLNAFGDIAGELGRVAARTEGKILADAINDNPNLPDGKKVFVASRGNVTAGSVLSASFDLAGPRKALRTRKGLDDETILGLRPQYILVGPDLEDDTLQLLGTVYPTQTSDVDPYTGKLEMLVESRLAEGKAYMIGRPADAPALIYSYREGMAGPEIRRTENPKNLGISWTCVLDFGAAWVDWRNWHLIQA